MPTIAKKEFDDYQRLCKDRNNGKILTLDRLQSICESYKNAPAAIGKHMMEVLVQIRIEGAR